MVWLVLAEGGLTFYLGAVGGLKVVYGRSACVLRVACELAWLVSEFN